MFKFLRRIVWEMTRPTILGGGESPGLISSYLAGEDKSAKNFPATT
jgi:hypothetical protein